MSAVPTLRFPEFDDEWKNEALSCLADIIDGDRGKNYPRSDEYFDDGFCLFLSAKNVTSRGFSFDVKQFISEEKDAKLSKGKLKRGDIVLTTRGTVGNFAYFDENVIFEQMRVNSGMVLLRSRKIIDPLFLYISCSSGPISRQVQVVAFGSAQPQLTVKDIKQFKVNSPSLPEQQKIASFLSSVDKKIDLLRQKKDALDLYKNGLMQKIFSQEIRFKQDDGSDFPDWEEVALGEVFAERSERGHGDKQLLGVTLYKGVVRASEIEKIDRSSSDLSNYKYVKMGDIAYNSMRMWQGASGASSYNGIVSPAYTVITPLGDNETKFWAYLFKYPEMIKVFERHSQGLTSDTWNLKFKALSTIKVLRPSGEEQKKISAFFNSIDAKLEKFSSQIEQMETFKKGLLQQMFV